VCGGGAIGGDVVAIWRGNRVKIRHWRECRGNMEGKWNQIKTGGNVEATWRENESN